MKFQRKQNTIRNSAWGFTNQIVQNLLPFICRTLLIKFLGAEYLGLNSLFASILQFLNLAEAGFGVSIVYSMYKPIAEDDNETICALLNLIKNIYRIVGCIVTVAGLVILPFLKFFIKSDYPSDINIYLLYCIYLLNLSLTYFLFAYKNSLFNAFQRTDRLSQIDTIISILRPVLQILILIFYKNLYIYVFVIPLTTLIKNIIVSVLASKTYPEYVCRGKVSKNQRNGIFKRTSGLFIAKISQTTRDSFDSIFISYFIGLVTVTIYSNYYYIMNAIHGFLIIICTSMTAGVGNFVASESQEKTENLFNNTTFLYMILSGWCFVCLMLLYQPFMNLWVGKDLMFSKKGVLLISLYFYMLTMGDIKGVFSGAFGMWWDFKYCSILESVSNIVLNFILVKKLGIYGILIGTIVNLFVFNFLWGGYILFKKEFSKKTFIKYILTHIKYWGITIVICFVCNMIASKIFGDYSIKNFVFRIFVCVTIAPALYFIFYRKKLTENTYVNKIVSKLSRKTV